MKKLLLFLLFCMSLMAASAQGEYYIYLQSENNQPFYVKALDKIWSSSSEGYILLPNLQDSVYTYMIGFPNGGTKEAKFNIALNGNDKGYVIKRGEDGMTLWDLQNATTLSPEKSTIQNNFTYILRTDAFSALLAKAAGDTTLLYEAVAIKSDVAAVDPKPEQKIEVNAPSTPVIDSVSRPLEVIAVSDERKQDTVKAETAKAETVIPPKDESKQEDVTLKIEEPKKDIPVQPDSTVTVERAVINHETKEKDSAVAVSAVPDEYKRSVVKKHAESSTSEGFGLVFHDKTGEETDTIRLLIPNPKYVIASQDTSAATDNQFFLPVNKDSLEKETPVQNVPIVVAVKAPPTSGCKATASEKDFFKLRLNMASKITDEEMVSDARKAFKSRCYTTEQIKNLSALFLTAAGKYLLFDAAYTHVSDRENFGSLQSQIKDDYYLRRFKALIGE